MLLHRRTVALVCVAALALTLTSCRDDEVPVPTFTAQPAPVRQETTVTNPDRPTEIRGLLDEIGALLARIRALLDPAPQPDPDPDPVPEPEPDEPLVAPTGLRATVDTATRKVRLDWDGHDYTTVIVESAYQGRRVQVGMTEDVFSVRGPLEPGRYLYHVAARSAAGEQSPDSAGVEVIIGAATTPEPAPAPEPEPDPDPPAGGDVPVGSRVVFQTDFADLNDFVNAQTFDRNGSAAGYSSRAIQVVNDGPGHETAARFEVRPGDVPNFGGGERAELRLDDEGNTAPGDERWYEFSLKFDDFPPPQGLTGGGHMIVMQWHTGSGSPLLTLNVDGRGNFTIGERWNSPAIIGPVDEGVWHDYVLHVKFSRGSDGLVEMWRDGRKVAERRQATHRDDANYLKLGIYRADEPFVQSLLYDNLRITAP